MQLDSIKLKTIGFLGLLVLAVLRVPIASAANDGPNLVALFGDSLSYGYNQAFPSEEAGMGRLNRGVPSIYLDEILRENKRVSLVANLGVGGSASGPSENPNLYSNNGVERISADLSATKSFYSPTKSQFALIIYGTNDYAYSIASSTTGFNIELMIDRAISQGFVPLVGTIPRCSCSNVIPRNNEIKAAVARKQSQGREVYLVDHYANLEANNWSSLIDPDGVHPNNDGYHEIASYWFDEQLEALIDRDTVAVSPLIMLLLD